MARTFTPSNLWTQADNPFRKTINFLVILAWLISSGEPLR